MRISRLAGITILLAAGTFALTACPASDLAIGQNAEARPDVFTPVTVTLAGPPPAPVLGSDGLYHLVYELRLTNTKPAPARLVKIQVLDADHPARVLATYQGAKLLDNLRTLQPRPAQSATIPLGEGRLFYIELTFQPGHIPLAITHHFMLYGAKDPGPTTPATRLEYTVATVDLDPAPAAGARPAARRRQLGRGQRLLQQPAHPPRFVRKRQRQALRRPALRHRLHAVE